ncbi:MAG: M4 family metallopeptidase [Sulfitobacter sp.]
MILRGDKSVRKMAESLMKVGESVREDRAASSGSGVVPTAEGAGTFVSRAMAMGASDVHTCNREVYDGENRAALPGTLVRAEGDAATGDEEVDRAYDGAGDVFDLYSEEFNRNSIDGFGMTMVQTVHHRRKYNNAFWNGAQMAYGDGDGEIFRTFTELSVIAHEISHGVVQHSGGLIYQGQSGALNESYADVFGAMTQQRALGQSVYEADWLVGKGILAGSQHQRDRPEINKGPRHGLF